MPRQQFRKSGADLRHDRCIKNLDMLGKLSERLYKGWGDTSPATMYHRLLCHLCPLVPVSAFQEAMDLVLKEKFQEEVQR